LPFLNAQAVVAEAAAKEDELGTEIAAAQAGGAVSDELTAKALASVLTTTTCCNQGYILQGFPETLEQASLLFGGKKADAEGEEPPPEDETEEGAGASKGLAAAPELVITLEAEEEVIKAKLLAQEVPSMSEEKLNESLAAYAANNQDDSPTSVLALPAFAEVEPLGPLSVAADMSIDSLLTKARVYLGQPRNYGPTDEEIAAKKQLEDAETARVAEAEAQATAEREAAETGERARREEHEARRAAEVQQQEQELLEVRSIPLRNYLMQNVIPTLTEGLIEVCKLKPEDPVDYLADYLFKNNPVEEEQ
jgi:adenylate kinase